MKCQVKNCNGTALIVYGSRMICGDCLIKILDKEKKKKDQLIDELGDENAN